MAHIPAYDAEIVSDDIPSSMMAGQPYTVHVTVRNTGSNVWTAAEGYKLGSPGDSDPFAFPRVHLDPSDSIESGQSKTFTFTMAPSTPGSYVTDWRMLQEGVTWFGETLSKTVIVGASFLSFEKLMRKYLREVKPKFILEWGTGNSTKMMLDECPYAEIHTIEHDYNWYIKWRRHYEGIENIHSYSIPLNRNYTLAPLAFEHRGKFDLIFIDGRRRVECMQTAKAVMSNTGVIILHDSERERYNEGKALFTIIEESDSTAVMKKRLRKRERIFTSLARVLPNINCLSGSRSTGVPCS